MKVLLTGCAGDIGRSISKILKENSVYIIGIDIDPSYPHSLYVDEIKTAPRVTETSYLEFIAKLVSMNSIDCIIPTTEKEMEFFLEKDIDTICGVPIVMANHEILKIGLDKKETFITLASKGIAIPQTYYSVDGLSTEKLPLICKGRHSSGSKEIMLLNTEDDFKLFTEDKILQEILVPKNEEYTCAIYVGKDVRTLVMKRELQAGRTIKGEVVKNEEIDHYLSEIVQALSIRGSINVQLILTNSGPKLFEINPRFSSTVYFRHLLGFKDLEWSIKDTLNIPYVNTFNLEDIVGKRIFRADEEIIY